MIYQVTTNSTPLKTDTSSNGKIITRLDRLTKVNVLEIDRRWAQILYNNEKAYISTLYLVPCEDADEKIDQSTTVPNIPDTTLSLPPTNNTTEDEVCDTNVEVTIPVNYSDTSEVLHSAPVEPEYVEVYGNLVVRYIDIDSKDSISDDKSYDNLHLGLYTVHADCINGYSIVGDSSECITLSDDCKIVVTTFSYKKITCEVTINYIDVNSNEIISPSIIYNNLDFGTYSYNSKSIDGYTALSDTINISLDSTLTEGRLNFIYKKID